MWIIKGKRKGFIYEIEKSSLADEEKPSYIARINSKLGTYINEENFYNMYPMVEVSQQHNTKVTVFCKGPRVKNFIYKLIDHMAEISNQYQGGER